MFERTLKIIKETDLEKIKKINVLLVGVGGVGGFVLESLIRLGIEHITIIDNDKIELSNLNRQILSDTTNIYEFKIDVAKERALKINPSVQIKTFNLFLNKDNMESIFTTKFDYIIDACDTITTKFLLIKKALELDTKIISCMGTGNRIDPSKIEITKLSKTYNDPLAARMRSILRKNNLTLNIPVVWSREVPIKTKENTPGSIILVPAAAGLQMAYYILNDLIK